MEAELKATKKFTGSEKQSKAYKQIVKMIDNREVYLEIKLEFNVCNWCK
jgi:hypothetical protein